MYCLDFITVLYYILQFTRSPPAIGQPRHAPSPSLSDGIPRHPASQVQRRTLPRAPSLALFLPPSELAYFIAKASTSNHRRNELQRKSTSMVKYCSAARPRLPARASPPRIAIALISFAGRWQGRNGRKAKAWQLHTVNSSERTHRADPLWIRDLPAPGFFPPRLHRSQPHPPSSAYRE